jgi:hypothetical protein
MIEIGSEMIMHICACERESLDLVMARTVRWTFRMTVRQ